MTLLSRTLAIVLALVVVGGGGAQASAAPDPSGPDFAIRAGMHGKTTIEKGHFVYDVAAPSKVKDSIELINLRAKKITLNIYAVDVLVAEGGGLAPAQPDVEKKSAGAWVKLSRSKVILGPSESLKVPFVIAVPKFATPGEHLGAIVATADGGRKEQGLAVETRVALQTVIRVKGEIEESLIVDKPTFSEGTFAVHVRNTGNVMLTPQGRIEVDGMKLPLSPAGIYVIPGGEATYLAKWDEAPWLGRVQAKAMVPVLLDGEEVGTYASGATTLTFIPWLWISIALGVVVLVVGLLRLARPRFAERSRRKTEDREIVRKFRESTEAGPS